MRWLLTRVVDAVGAQTGLGVEQHGGLDLMRVALLGLLPQTTALNLLEQRGPTDHSGAAAPGPGGQAGVGGGQPGVNRLLALGLTQGGLEGTGVDDRDEAGDVSEAQRGQPI